KERLHPATTDQRIVAGTTVHDDALLESWGHDEAVVAGAAVDPEHLHARGHLKVDYPHVLLDSAGDDLALGVLLFGHDYVVDLVRARAGLVEGDVVGLVGNLNDNGGRAGTPLERHATSHGRQGESKDKGIVAGLTVQRVPAGSGVQRVVAGLAVCRNRIGFD